MLRQFHDEKGGAMAKRDRRQPVTRRDLLKTSALAAGSAALLGNLSRTKAAGVEKGGDVVVYRLRTRNTNSCNACGIHHRYKIFLTMTLADRNRAHPGCNCPIVMQRLPEADYLRLFGATGCDRTGVVDLRNLSCDVLLVVLDTFTAEATKRGVLLRWRTLAEIDHVGFRVLRATSGGNEKNPTVISREMIQSRGDALSGASYRFLDPAEGVAGKVRYYLEDIDRWGEVTRHGPVAVGLPVR